MNGRNNSIHYNKIRMGNAYLALILSAILYGSISAIAAISNMVEVNVAFYISPIMLGLVAYMRQYHIHGDKRVTMQWPKGHDLLVFSPQK